MPYEESRLAGLPASVPAPTMQLNAFVPVVFAVRLAETK